MKSISAHRPMQFGLGILGSDFDLGLNSDAQVDSTPVLRLKLRVSKLGSILGSHVHYYNIYYKILYCIMFC